MADDAEAPLESDSEEEDTTSKDRRTTTRKRVTQNVSLSGRRQSLTFAFAIIGAMLVLRHHWFGAALKWSKAPAQAALPPQPFARDEGTAPHPQ